MGTVQPMPRLTGGGKKPKALVVLHEDGSATEYPFTWPPRCYGFEFIGHIGEIMKVHYACYADGEPQPAEESTGAGAAESP